MNLQVRWPYDLSGSPSESSQKKSVVFFGADFYNMTEVDVPLFIQRTNECLTYIRKQYSDHKLIYRPHPDEKKELEVLDLHSYVVESDQRIAEEYLTHYHQEIEAVFSVCSTSSIAGYNMGLNAYSFFRYFRGVFRGTHKLFVEKYFSNLPPDFFIKDLNVSLQPNYVVLKEDDVFLEHVVSILNAHSGSVWFVVAENRFLVALQAVARRIKKVSPDRKMYLMIAKHHRWNEQQLQSDGLFDQVLVFPRHFYSISPWKLWSAFQTARAIKKLSLGRDPIIIGFAHHNFVENCLISYHPDAYKVSFIPENTWEINFQTKAIGFDMEKLSFNKAGRFYYDIFEPLLGLYPTLFRQYRGESTLYFIRPEKQLDQIYNTVFLMQNSPHR